MGPPSAGGLAVLQILKQLERFDLRRLGPDNLISWHLMAESQRLAFADREAFGADADFAPVPVDGLLDPGYLKARSALIRIDRAMPTVAPGTPKGTAPRKATRLGDIPATSHLAAADDAGNVATLTSTIEGPFGSGLVASGIVLNNQLTDFDFVPHKAGIDAFNRIEPGKRPRSSMAPVIVYDRRNRPLAAFGAAGGATIIAQVSKALIAYLDWGLPVEQALAAPQIYADSRGTRLEAGSRLEAMAAALKALGHQNVTAATLPLKGNAVARVGGGWRGAADPRSEGQALAAEGGGQRAAQAGTAP
jgi:gamma-glutamyltranspeptidase/glutathione hydrolase